MINQQTLIIFLSGVLLALISACSGTESKTGTEGERINLGEQSEIIAPNTATFRKIQVYEDSLLLDSIGDIAVSGNGTLYLAGEKWNHKRIHSFTENGRYIGNFAGPDGSEFREIAGIQLMENELWVMDPTGNNIHQVNRSSGEITSTLDLNTLGSVPAMTRSAGGSNLVLQPMGGISGGRILFTFHKNRDPAYQPEGELFVGIAPEDSLSEVSILLHEKQKRYMVGDYAGKPVPFTIPVNEKPLIDFTSSGRIYSAYSAEFSIRVFSAEGSLMHTYTYPVERRELQPEEDLYPEYTYNRQLLMIRETADYPSHWPALYDLFVDDQQRLWVSAVTENRNLAEWFVIDDKTQTLVARFTWSVDKPIRYVKNGTAYTVEKNSAGFEVVASYDISSLSSP